MRRLISLGLAPLALAVALMLPTSTFAISPYGVGVHKDHCTSYPANVF